VEYVLALVLLAMVVLAVVLAPLLRGGSEESIAAERRGDLEAAREVKYREIREAELDHRTGKLSYEDWRRTDRELRTQAIELLRRLDELE
jgi:hypothetical protein